jgi:hypothetical protein
MKVNQGCHFPHNFFGKKQKASQSPGQEGGGQPPQDPNASGKDALAAQQQSDQEQEALTQASNMQKKAHETCMQIINNIK